VCGRDGGRRAAGQRSGPLGLRPRSRWHVQAGARLAPLAGSWQRKIG
jgi:hypothetical protein